MNHTSTTYSDEVFWYIQDLAFKIVAQSGIPSDRYHLGKLLLHSLKDAPEHILQIDGATDEKDTFKSALQRSTRCATAFRNLGLKYHDAIVIMAPNHINLVIPMYASLYLGIKVAGVDMTLGMNFNIHCLLKMSTRIIGFDENEDYLILSKFLEDYGGEASVDDFKTDEFDPAKTVAFLVTTSGTTGLPKTAILNHKNVVMGFPAIMTICTKFPTPVDLALVVSPIQWLSSTFNFIMSPILRYTRLQSSSPATPDHIHHLINKYKPDFANMSPNFLRSLLKPGDREKCDFSCLKYLLVAGSFVAKELVEETKKIIPKLEIQVVYGMTEATGTIFNPAYAKIGSVGTPMSYLQYKLVDPTTNEKINEPNVPGELRITGPTVFQGYHNNPEMTAAAFDEDGWLKTGDIFYRDENHNYCFCDRLKMLLKYRNHQVSPIEIESVIVTHPGVLDAAVTGVPDAECGDLPVALVVRRDGHHVTAQEIKDLVKGIETRLTGLNVVVRNSYY